MRDDRRPRLLCLFDIDGTLVHVPEELAFARAFREQCGPDVDLSYRPGLLVTDSAYIADVLERFHGRGAAEHEVATVIERFVELLDALCEAGEAPLRPLPGVGSFVEALAARAALAVSTGCVEPSARWKLRRAGLERAFPCGGFSRSEGSRAEIVRRAIAAAEDCYAARFERVVLFGDGPWDLTSAREAQVGFIGINEQARGRARLRDLGARHVFADYADGRAILDVIDDASAPA